jgi:hypothetical protein
MRTLWSKPHVALGMAMLCLAMLSAMDAPLVAQSCKTPINTTRKCTGSGGCMGQYESGYCGLPENNPQQCRLFYVPCCYQNYNFAENDFSCLQGAACGKASEGTVARLVYLPPVAKNQPRRVAVVSAVPSKGGSVAPAPASKAGGM